MVQSMFVKMIECNHPVPYRQALDDGSVIIIICLACGYQETVPVMVD